MVFYFEGNEGSNMKKNGQQDGHMHTDTTENNIINSNLMTKPHVEGFMNKHCIVFTWNTT